VAIPILLAQPTRTHNGVRRRAFRFGVDGIARDGGNLADLLYRVLRWTEMGHNFAIDFDRTMTLDGEMFRQWIEIGRDLGHSFFCVTARRDTPENREQIDNWLLENGIEIAVHYTSLRSKIDYMANRGIKIDVWIDDDPLSLVKGH